MSAAEVTEASKSPALEDRIRAVSSLEQVESHVWNEGSWVASEHLLDSVEAELELARG
ncbi:MAG: hypothetical protein WB947_04170 [Thermoplasmata archaeon]